MEDDYLKIAENLDKFLMGAPKIDGKITDTFIKYLKILIPPEYTKIVLNLPIYPNLISVRKLVKIIELSQEETNTKVEFLTKRGVLIRSGKKFGIAPPLFLFDGLFWETLPEPEATEAAQLSHKYLLEGDWFKLLEGSPNTPLSRVIPVNQSVASTQQILSHEEIYKLIDEAQKIGVIPCECRSRLEKIGERECDFPIHTCLAFNMKVDWADERDLAKHLTKEEAKALIDRCDKLGLLHLTENYKDTDHMLLCNCCPCCCSIIGGITRWDNPRAVAKANFVVELTDPESCVLCGNCENRCLFKAISIDEDELKIDLNKCMGCGVCTVECNGDCLKLRRLDREEIYDNQGTLIFKVMNETGKKLEL